jgi:hypothetical protein
VDGFGSDTNQAVGHSAGRSAETSKPRSARPVGNSTTGRPTMVIYPVTVDEAGRIFDADGKQVIATGLEPEAILEGLEDVRAGRMRPLKEIIASRNQHGI